VRNVSALRDQRIDAVPSANRKVIRQPAGVRLNCAWCQPEIGLDLQPTKRLSARGNDWPTPAQTWRIVRHPVIPLINREGFLPAPLLPRDHYDYDGVQITGIPDSK